MYYICIYIYIYTYIYIYIQIFTYTDILFYLTNVQKKISLILINKYESLTKEKHPLKKGKLPTSPKYYIPPPSSLIIRLGRVVLFQHAFLKTAEKDSDLMHKTCNDMRCNAILTFYPPPL